MNRLASTLLLSLFGTLLPLEATLADDDAPALSYAAPNSEWMRLDNGVVLEGSDLSSLDTNTTGFRLTAGFSPEQLPRLDIGAEIAYRESEEVPITSQMNPLLMDTLSLGGALVAGVRMGAVSIYAKSGFTEWRGEAYQPQADDGGTALLQGFGATMTINRLISRFEYERIDAATLSHLNMLSASLHLPF
ncbi:MAG: hypothetical protein VYB20_10230 [Pseudomonadota bacterium]|jgi:hypothetical protein|uniref:Outer membrane protein beta-barrel domain-containing protein n=1 Tax=Vreelandella aquamarina TaxID=77097 RepID=A0A1N6D1W9_9GAMM|nr:MULTISPECIES: hypothetical protein [Halomonas]KTG25457.1 hypothetical protein AUR68_01415 [Idiomarina sp. H105]MEC7296152.1 hypothetical protein [Pseudomonadota bacterium]OAE96083.1 hypothetical protein AWR38_01420 [Idiomarina sp. WRN-38]MCC4286870.1 hypothetical protein [Halomonas meridiana]MCC4290032.1 hypothetical protein [Halomonas axialensis]|tara:strand:- start:554 stop:1123 length:570 start_codon:yes stop_codon:yes gene_type:complete